MVKFVRIILSAAIMAIAAFDLMAEDIPNHFVHITMSDGLSSNTVISVTGDRNGCIWVGTENGLNKYDGYDIEVFTHNTGDPHSLSGNIVNKVAALPDGSIAVCTTNGLSIFDFSNRTFSNYSCRAECWCCRARRGKQPLCVNSGEMLPDRPVDI